MGEDVENGIVEWFNPERGYGFIKCDDGKDIFVHFSKIIADDGRFKIIYQGDKVEFEIINVDRSNGQKVQAINVRVIDEIQSNNGNNSVRGRSNNSKTDSV